MNAPVHYNPGSEARSRKRKNTDSASYRNGTWYIKYRSAEILANLVTAIAVLCVMTLCPVARAADFPYGGRVEVYMYQDAISPNGLIDRSKVFVLGLPAGVSTRNFGMFADLYHRASKVAEINCRPGNITAGRTSIYDAVSCNWTVLPLPPGTSPGELRASTSLDFWPRGYVDLHYIITDKNGVPDPTYQNQVFGLGESEQISRTELRDAVVRPRPPQLPAVCGNVSVSLPGPPVSRRSIEANVYVWPSLSPSGTLDPSQVCVAATPRGGDVNGLNPFGAIYAVRGHRRTVVARFACALVAPATIVRQDQTLLYELASCDIAPKQWRAPAGARLEVRFGLFFGLPAPMKVGDGPVLRY